MRTNKTIKLTLITTALILLFISCTKKAPLSLWNDQAFSKQELISYVKSVTDKNSKDYIPEERRIAVFDMDGTVFCETDPVYFEWILYEYRVLYDEEYSKIATDVQKQVALAIHEARKTGSMTDELEELQGEVNPQIYSGMTIKEFCDYVNMVLDLPSAGFTNLKYKESFYKPMLQVIDYLIENKFIIYFCSGTDRFAVRAILKDVIPVPERQVIGTDKNLVASHQMGKDNTTYVFTPEDEVLTGNRVDGLNIKMNKVASLAREIGVKPVLAFGNSTGDESMANYVISKNEYKSAAFMLLCDDTEREYGNIPRAEKIRGLCEKYGWIPVSMKNDWKTIYGDQVKKRLP